MIYDIAINGKNYRLELSRPDGRWTCRLDGREIEVDGVLPRPNVLSLRIGNKAYEVKCERVAGDLHLWVGSERFGVEVRDAPMPGKIVRVLVSQGTQVEAGTGVLVVEAMKMQNEVKSPKKGTIQKILVSEGAAVNAGDVLAIVE